MGSDRDYGILIKRLEKALHQANMMKLDLLAHLLQMALLEVAHQISEGLLRAPLGHPRN